MVVSALGTSVAGRLMGLGWFFSTAALKESSFLAWFREFTTVFKYSLTLTTFVVTFFVTHSHSFWSSMYKQSRTVQGGMNNIGILAASHTARDGDGVTYSKEGSSYLDEVSGFMRLFSPFLYAAQSRRFRVLLTDRGLKSLERRGFLTQEQRFTLLSLDLPRTDFCNVVLEWILTRTLQARKDGAIQAGDAFEQVFFEKVCELRGSAAGIGGLINGRMPLVYVHFVRILVDWVIVSSPFALFTELGSMSFLCIGILALFYEGMLDLSKVLLDPLENEDYCDGGIEMDLGVLIQESNAGSIRWKKAGASLPFVYRR
jgi:Bestrophin, RFP-TM, chloride channel